MKKKRKKKNGKLIPFLVGVLCVSALSSFLDSKDEEIIPTTEPTEIVSEVTQETIQQVTEAPTEAPTQATEPPVTELSTEAPTTAPTEASTESTDSQKVTYVLNINPSSMKFHYPGCKSVSKMKESNKQIFEGTREEVIAMGYSPCGNCHP